MNQPILVVPAVERGRGSGHLRRSIALVRSLRSMGRKSYLFVPPRPVAGGRNAEELKASLVQELDPDLLFVDDPSSRPWSIIVLDRFRCGVEEARLWTAMAPVVAIDEGGPARKGLDYLIDVLGVVTSSGGANVEDAGFLSLPSNRKSPRSGTGDFRRILVSFGGEDSGGLGKRVATALSHGRQAEDPPIDLLIPSFVRRPWSSLLPIAGVRELDPIPNLKEHLADWDLVVTQYGLTAFEAAWSGVPVLLVSPTALHERLARRRGFLSAGRPWRALSRLRAFLRKGEALRSASSAVAPTQQRDLGAFIASLTFTSGTACPACGQPSSPHSPYLERFEDRSYRRCQRCGMVHMVRAVAQTIRYEKSYFFEEYNAQYGLTYLEDFPALKAAGLKRAGRMVEILGFNSDSAPKPTLLDIGCAYGPFLSAASDAGFQVYGLDPIEDAVRWVRDELGLHAQAGFFPGVDPALLFGVPRFDAISLWYVIEHFDDLGEVLRRIFRLLKPGGVLAFSTPSLSGISALKDRRRFLQRSPGDHYTLWEPRRCAAFLRAYGFDLVKTVSTGHHPERFPLLETARPDSLAFKAAASASRVFRLGDTFEAYALRRSDRNE